MKCGKLELVLGSLQDDSFRNDTHATHFLVHKMALAKHACVCRSHLFRSRVEDRDWSSEGHVCKILTYSRFPSEYHREIVVIVVCLCSTHIPSFCTSTLACPVDDQLLLNLVKEASSNKSMEQQSILLHPLRCR